MSEKLKVLVLGSTGPLGREVLANAPDTMNIRAFARNPQALADQAGNFEAVKGDVRDEKSLLKALDGIDIVISCVGSKPFNKEQEDLHEVTAQNLLKAMDETGVERVIAVTGLGAGDSWGHGPIWYDKIVRPYVLNKCYEDKERMEELLKDSNVEWEIVRPGVLKNKATGRPLHAVTHLASGEKVGSISREDVAKFLLSEATDPLYSDEVVHLYT